MVTTVTHDIDACAQKIRVLVLDIDGVLTDGRLIFLPGGGEARTFHVRDGLGTQLLVAAGIPVAAISGRASDTVTRRAAEIGISPLFQGVDDKVKAFEQVLKQFDTTEDAVAYIGDDLPDLPLIERAGLGMAVADAALELRQKARHVLRAAGGQGAVREACELILRAKGKWIV
ncbi:MAG: HAD hydrolase family protein [Deltaproteobacteria bacterium]|nr:HAD hydrolase family protein [Deltaproteobacteria bacterium]